MAGLARHMQQDRDELVRGVIVRVKSQAAVCQYTVKCPSCFINVDNTPFIVRDLISGGPRDDDIQLEMLGHTVKDMTFENVLSFVESKLSRKR